LDHHNDINGRMRQILIAWVYEVADCLELETRTFHLCVTYIDKYLSTRQIMRNRLQLLGVTALLLASKVEEVLIPLVQDLSRMTDHAVKVNEIIAFEKELLEALDFALYLNVFESEKDLEVCAAILLSIYDNMTNVSVCHRNRMIRGIATCLRTSIMPQRGKAKDILGLLSDDQLDLRFGLLNRFRTRYVSQETKTT